MYRGAVLSILITTLLADSVGSQPQSDSWPMFGHDSRRSRLSGAKWGDSRGARIRWRFLGREASAASTPVYNSSAYYVGCTTSSEINLTTGIATPLGGLLAAKNDRSAPSCNSDFKVSGSSAAVGIDGSLYVGLAAGFLAGVGGISQRNGTFLSSCGPVSSSPAIDARGIVYFTAGVDSVFAVDSFGGVLWNVSVDSLGSSPALDPAGSRVYVATLNGAIFALNSSTGAMLWTVSLLSSASLSSGSSSQISSFRLSFRSTPSVSQDGSTLYIVSADNALIAFDLTQANLLPAGSSEKSDVIRSSFVLWGKSLNKQQSSRLVKLPYESSPVSVVGKNALRVGGGRYF
jgi:outer membrane protein assembly factor BamB